MGDVAEGASKDFLGNHLGPVECFLVQRQIALAVAGPGKLAIVFTRTTVFEDHSTDGVWICWILCAVHDNLSHSDLTIETLSSGFMVDLHGKAKRSC